MENVVEQVLCQQDSVLPRLSSSEGQIVLLSLSSASRNLCFDENELALKIRIKHKIGNHIHMNSFIKSLKQTSIYQSVIILLAHIDDVTMQAVSLHLYRFRQIKFVFILNEKEKIEKFVPNLNTNTAEKTVWKTYTSYQTMLAEMKKTIYTVHEENNGKNTIVTLNCRQRALKDLHHELGPFIWMNTFKSIILAMPHNSLEAKSQMIAECRKIYRKSKGVLKEIKKFEKEYQSCNAISYYTMQCFLYRVVNMALRSENPFVLYTFRFYIFDLSTQIYANRIQSEKNFSVYRGAIMDRNEVECLEIGCLVANNGFFSSSKCRVAAEFFLGLCPETRKSPSKSKNEEKQFVLFHITVDWDKSPDIVVVDASRFSTIAHEEEILFDMGTTFFIEQINYDDQACLWHIHVSTTSELSKLTKHYDDYVRERLKEFHPSILFGRILMTNLAEYRYALHFFHHLLRNVSLNDEDRASVLFELARTYRFQGRFQRSIEHFQRALSLQRENLPKSKFACATTLAGISTVYLEMNDSKQAWMYINESEIYFRDFPFDFNYETIFQANRTSYAFYLDGEHEKALSILQMALEVYKEKMPNDHPSHAQAWHNLGLVQHAMNRIEDALKSLKEALRMRKNRLSPDHPYIARTQYQLSLLYEQVNDIQLALEYGKAALIIRKKSLPIRHPELIESISLLDRLETRVK